MADNNRASAFLPDLSGPFSEALNPTAAQQREAQQAGQIPVPGAKIPRTAAAAAMIDKFLESFQASRMRSFQMQQAQQTQQVGVLQAKMNQILNDTTRTDSDKMAAIQPLYRAYGQIMGGAIDQGEQGGGKKKGKKDGATQGGDQQQGHGVGHHLLGIAKDFATGLAGGKLPKELNPDTVKQIVGTALVDSDVAYNKAPTIEKLTEQFNTGMAKTASGVQGKSWEEAAPAFDQYRSMAQRLDPSGALWKNTIADYQTRFSSAPPGSKEYYQQNPDKFRAAFKASTGNDPTPEQTMEAVWGIKAPTTRHYGPNMPGSAAKGLFPTDMSGQPVTDGKTYKTVTEGGKDIGVIQVEGPRPTREQEAQQAADDFYREQHKLSADDELGPKQKADAKREYGAYIAKSASDNPVFDIQAWDFITKGTFDTGGMGTQALQMRQNIVARAQQIMDANGLGPADVIALRAGLKADVGALARVTTQGAVVDQLEEQLGQNMKIARDLSAAYKRSDIQFVNRIKNAFLTGTGDDEAVNLAAQLHAVSREWAKLMQGQTSASGVSINEAKETDALMSKAMGEGQLESLFKNVVEKDATTRSNAIGKVRRDLLNSIRGAVPEAKHIKDTPGAKSAVAVNNVSGIKQDGSFVEYGSPADSFRATVSDLSSKIAGKTSTGLSGSSTLNSLVNTWTTGDQNGTDQGYSAEDVAKYLSKKGLDVTAKTPISQIPPEQLAAAIAHFETGYEAPDDVIQQSGMAIKAEAASGTSNPFRQNKKPTAPNAPPGAGNDNSGDPVVDKLVDKYKGH